MACGSVVFSADFRSFKRLNTKVWDILVGCNGDWVALLHHNP